MRKLFPTHSLMQMAGCGRDNLLIDGPWKWLIQQFAHRFGVPLSYTLMAHLRWVFLPSIVSQSARCFKIIGLLISPVLKLEIDGGLSREEVWTGSAGHFDCELIVSLGPAG